MCVRASVCMCVYVHTSKIIWCFFILSVACLFSQLVGAVRLAFKFNIHTAHLCACKCKTHTAHLPIARCLLLPTGGALKAPMLFCTVRCARSYIRVMQHTCILLASPHRWRPQSTHAVLYSEVCTIIHSSHAAHLLIACFSPQVAPSKYPCCSVQWGVRDHTFKSCRTPARCLLLPTGGALKVPMLLCTVRCAQSYVRVLQHTCTFSSQVTPSKCLSWRCPQCRGTMEFWCMTAHASPR